MDDHRLAGHVVGRATAERDAAACTLTLATPSPLAVMLSMSPPWCAPLSTLPCGEPPGLSAHPRCSRRPRCNRLSRGCGWACTLLGVKAADLAGEMHAVAIGVTLSRR
jgi:hypothetical protein